MDFDIERVLRAVKDTRVHSGANVTNEYLSWLEDMRKDPHSAQVALSTGQVKASLKRTLAEGAPLAFTVALSMARTPEDHVRLWELLSEVYFPEEEGDMELLLWPLCATIGAQSPIRIPREIPIGELEAALLDDADPVAPEFGPIPGDPVNNPDWANFAMPDPGRGRLDPLADPREFSPVATKNKEKNGAPAPASDYEGFDWAPVLLDADEVASISPDTWYRLKKGGPEAFSGFAAGLPKDPFCMGATAGCRLFFCIAARPWSGGARAGGIPGGVLMRLMEFWSKRLKIENSVICPVPLAPADPSKAFREGVDCLRGVSLMAANSNIIKTIRLRGGSPGVALAAKEGGRLACLYYDMNAPRSPPSSYDVRLGPADDLGGVIGELVGLFEDCAVRNLYVMTEVLGRDASAPSGWNGVGARPGFFLIGS